MVTTSRRVRRGPLIASGVVIGAGLGGFVDGIVLHQILQWHNMLSAQIPPETVVAIKTNMVWDGVFHAAVSVMTAAGLAMLWRAGGQADVPWSGRTFLGSLVAGWGLFNVVEGLIDHHLLGLHHVNESSENWLAWDLGFLVFGAALLGVGWAMIRAAAGDTVPRGGARTV